MEEAGPSKRVYCSNPFKHSGHKYHKKNLRTVNDNLLKRHGGIVAGDKICDSCRKAILKLPLQEPETESEQPETESEQTNEREELLLSTPEKEQAIESLNESLSLIDETPVKKKRLTEKKYPENKLKKVTEAFRTKILGLSPDNPVEANYDSEIINQLKEKFNSTQDKSLQMQILTTLPKSWTLKQIESEFGVSNFMARKAKNLVKEKGVMSSPDPKPGKTLCTETADIVRKFYESDDISRQMPGKKDFVSVRVDGKRTHVQKFLILNTLRECFSLFKERYPEQKIGFSKFCELRPKHCVLPGSAGTHAVCVCTVHQNAKLMMAQCKLPELVNRETPVTTYKDLTNSIICYNPTEKCYFRECTLCPDTDNMKFLFEDAFEQNSIEHVTYKKWVQVDNKCVLETLTKSTGDFIDSLFDSLPKLIKHSFIATKQSAYLRHLKENIPSNECIVLCDFAENYSFVLQDEAQGFHWNNAQSTIHPFVIYFKEGDTLQHLSLVIISDCMAHDTVAVHLFQRHLISFLKEKLPQLEKIHYFSDGAASQYKNKTNFLNLCHHTADFSINAEWNFFASSHGKNACDGVGGAVKRLAAQASLRMVYNEQIMTPRQLFDWATENISNINFIYSTNEDYEHEKTLLKTRLEEAKTVKGTQQFHHYKPKNETRVVVKTYSFANDAKEEVVSENDVDSDLELEEIVGFVTCMYDKEWWLGCVISTTENEDVKISFLEPHGPSPSFKYPRVPDILLVNKTDVLTKVDPTTQTGRVYHLTELEKTKATKKLQSKLKKRNARK